MNIQTIRKSGYLLTLALACTAGSAFAAYKDFASDAMSAASGFSGGSVSGKTLTVTDASKLVYVPGGSNDSLNRKDRGWYAGATIRWPEGGARDDDASMQTSRMASSVSGTSDLSGTTLTRTTEHARAHTCMATTTWWGYITPEEAYAKKTGNFTTTLTMSGKHYGATTFGVNPATFTIDFPVDGLVLKDDKGVQWYPVVATNGTTAKVYGDLNVALKDGGEVVSVADAAITNAITLEAGVTFRKNGKAVTGLEKLTLLGGSYDFDPNAAGCTLGEGCIAQYNQSTLLYDVIPCPHEWSYEIIDNGATFKATCAKGCGYTPQSLTISLSATSKTYDGTEISASLTYNKSEAEFKEQTGATVGAIVYSGDRKSAGEQKASVTITVFGGQEYTISKTLTIDPAPMSTATVTLQSARMNFADKELTNAVSSVSVAAPAEISANDWEIDDPTVLYQTGSGYSNCTYTVTLKGKNNFDGTTTATWTILAPTVTFATDAMGRGDFETGGKLYNDNYGEAASRELVVTATTNIIFVNGHWFVGATVDVPNDVRVFAPSDSQITPDENLRVTVSTTGKTYTGTQISGGQVKDTIFQVLDDDHDEQWWAGLGTFQYFKKIRWFTEISPAMVEQAKLDGKDELTFTLTVGGTTGRWEGLKYTDFVIKAPLDGFVFKVGRNEFNTADIGNVAFSTNAPSIQLIADSVVTNACAIDYKTKKRIFTDVENYSVFETKVSDSCWVYSCEHSIVTITVPNVANQASKVVKVGETVKVAIDADKTQYEVRYGDTVTIDYTAAAGYLPPTDTKTMTNVKDGDALTDLPVFTWPTFKFDPAAPTNTTAAVSTNGVELTAPYVINSNDTVHVVYKADAGCYFADGTTEKTIDDMTITTNTVVSAEKRPAQAWPAHVCDGVTFTKRIADTASLKALFDDDGNGYLATNVTLTADITGYCENHLCLNGQVLDMNGQVLKAKTALTIHDCGATTNYFTIGEDGLWALTDDIAKADTNLVGGVVTGGRERTDYCPILCSTYYGNSWGLLTIKGGNFVGNDAGNSYGGVIYGYWGNVVIDGGVFAGNCSEYGGGVAYIYDSELTVNGGTFVGNDGGQYGGVFFVKDGDYYDTSLVITNGTFTGNTADNGGVIYAASVTAIVNGGTFADNTAENGGVYFGNANADKLTVNGGTFTGNKVEGKYEDYPSGTVFYNNGTMLLQGDAVISNNVGAWGTIYNYGTLTVTGDVQVVDNVVTANGGAIYNRRYDSSYPGVCRVYGGTFTGNGDYTAFVNSSCGTFELGGSPVIEDNGNKSGEYDLVAAENSPFALSENVPYAADQVVTVGSFVADGTNDFITVVENAQATDVDRFVACDPAYATWFDAKDSTLKLVLPVAQIVTNGVTNLFATLDAAIEVAETNDTVTLLKACKSDGEAIDLPLTLDRDGNAVTNLTLGAGAVLTLKGETESPNKLRSENPKMFGTIADRAKVVTDTTYVYFETLKAFYKEGHEAVATTYGEDGVTYLDSYPTFTNAIANVATNGVVYTLKEEISTPGFAIRRNMTIDLEKANPTGTNTLTITSPYADKKTTGIYVDKKTTDVAFVGGAVVAAAGSGIRTLVETASCKLTFCWTVVDGLNLDTAKTPYAVTVLNGGLTLIGTKDSRGKHGAKLLAPEAGYALNVNCYGNASGVTVACAGLTEYCAISNNVLLNVQVDVPVNMEFDKTWIGPRMDVNAFNAKTVVTKSATTDDPELNKTEYNWAAEAGHKRLVFGVAKVVSTGMCYSTFTNAVANAARGDTVILLNDAIIPNYYYIPKSLTLDLNGHTLSSELSGSAALRLKDGFEVTVYGTNENSRIAGNLNATSSSLIVRGGRCDGNIGCFGTTGTIVLNGVDLRFNSGNCAYASGGTTTLLNSRLTSPSGISVINGNLVVSNTVVQATGEAGNAIKVSSGGQGKFVKLMEGTKLLSTEGTDQLYWDTNKAAQVVITKKDGIDCLAQKGFGWTDIGEGVLQLVPSTATYDVMPKMFTKNLFNLAPAMKLNTAGQLTLDSDASVEVAGETVEVKPDDITITVGDTADVITVKSIPDLTYELLAKESLAADWTVVETKVATSAETAFTAEKDGAAAKFYTVRVRY